MCAGSSDQARPSAPTIRVWLQIGDPGAGGFQALIEIKAHRERFPHEATPVGGPSVKTAVLEAIGEVALQRGAQVNAALAANDRVKYLLTLLQTALSQADHPEQAPVSLTRERVACGIVDASLDDIVVTARRQGERYRLSGCAQVLARIAQDMRVMAAPVIAERGADDGLARRLETLLAGLPDATDGLIDRSSIERMTRIGSGDGDSLHQLVMDLHKALNALVAEFAEEKLDGASIYGLEADDRPRVAAFMAGVNRTAPLKFDHPGLGCMATRSAGQLVMQNDIGTTDAHVIVVHVEDLRATLTYTDVHPERARFLRDMLSRFAVTWSGERTEQRADLGGGTAFVLMTGQFVASDEAELRSYLTFLGSRLVFLIDWNRARKQLRSFLPGARRSELLRWAAEAEVGHRAFLQLGGARLINEAIEATAGSAVHFGDRLCDVLGEAAAMNFLQFSFRAASEGLLARHSRGLVRDRIRAELAVHFSNEAKRLLGVAADHAGLVFEIATLVRDGTRSDATDADWFDRMAQRARAFEHDADQLVTTTREVVRRRSDLSPLFDLIEAADDAADELEEAAFLMQLLAKTDPADEALQALAVLADVLVAVTQEWVKAVAHAAHVEWSPRDGSHDGSGLQDDVDDFLTAIERVAALEHEADDDERALTSVAVQQAQDFRQLHLYAEIGRSLEEGADALKRASLLAREHVLGRVLGN